MKKSSVRSEVKKMKPWTAWAIASVTDGENPDLRVYDLAQQAAENCGRGEHAVRVEVRELVPPKTKRKK